VVGVCCCMRVLLLVYLPRQPALVLTHSGRAGGREGGGRREGGKEGDESVNCEGVLWLRQSVQATRGTCSLFHHPGSCACGRLPRAALGAREFWPYLTQLLFCEDGRKLRVPCAAGCVDEQVII